MPYTNESLTEAAFSRQSSLFDDLYAGNTIVQYKRERVRRHVLQYLAPQAKILELNSGTGEDAIFFAKKGCHVHATDLSSGMLEVLRQKVSSRGLQQVITSERCSFTDLDQLQDKGPYDLIFSNFAGLNCTGDLARVVGALPSLLKPGGFITLVVLPPFCLWETALVVRGKVKTAFRRFFARRGRIAWVEGLPFRCWYYSPSLIQKALGPAFVTLDLEGLCTLVPPSYIEGFAEKHPGLYRSLRSAEDKSRRRWPWKSIGDYFIITLQKTGCR